MTLALNNRSELDGKVQGLAQFSGLLIGDWFILVRFLEELIDDIFARRKLVPLALYDKATREWVHVHFSH